MNSIFLSVRGLSIETGIEKWPKSENSRFFHLSGFQSPTWLSVSIVYSYGESPSRAIYYHPKIHNGWVAFPTSDRGFLEPPGQKTNMSPEAEDKHEV